MLRRPLASLRESMADAHVRRILTLMLPASLAVSVAQVSLIINTHIASRLQTGSVSWLSYADRLMEFPTALLGVALGTVLLPSLTKAHNSNEQDRVSALIDWGLRMVMVLAVPASVGLAVLAIPLASALFHYGAFDDQDLVMTAQAMVAYAVGLTGLIAVKVLAPGFYARQDIRTPVKIALLTLVTTQLLNLVLVPLYQHAGLALATGLAACLNAGLLFWKLRSRGAYAPMPGWLSLLIRIVLAAAVMGALLYWLSGQLNWLTLRQTPGLRIAALAGLMATAALSYFGLLSLMRVRWLTILKGPR
jgi:putative peptidoglycan lipid II flippase